MSSSIIHAFDAENELSASIAHTVASVAAVVVDVLDITSSRSMKSRRGSQPGRLQFRKRTRRSVKDIYKEMGPIYFRRAYRM
jgi:hypothetical protein